MQCFSRKIIKRNVILYIYITQYCIILIHIFLISIDIINLILIYSHMENANVKNLILYYLLVMVFLIFIVVN